jgi:hypothetical protein
MIKCWGDTSKGSAHPMGMNMRRADIDTSEEERHARWKREMGEEEISQG